MEALKPDDPKMLGDYRLLACIGEGGMGRVYLGASSKDTQVPAGEHVAIKVVLLDTGDDVPREHRDEYESRFAREIEVMRSVAAPNTALYVDADAEATPPWLATQYVPGPTLQSALAARGKPLTPEAVAIMGSHLAEGLAAIHRAGLAHRDVKPTNVMLSDEGPKMIDFGLSVLVGRVDDPRGHVTTLGMVPGTQAWMSPEQAQGEADETSDVYALGAVLAYGLTRKRPNRYRTDLTGVDTTLAGIVREMMAPAPADRPTASEVAKRLHGLAGRLAGSTTAALGGLIDATYGAYPPPEIPDLPSEHVNTSDHDGRTKSHTATPSPAEPRQGAHDAAEQIRIAYASSRKLLVT